MHMPEALATVVLVAFALQTSRCESGMGPLVGGALLITLAGCGAMQAGLQLGGPWA